MDIWGVFEARVLGPLFQNAEPVPYEQIVARFGFKSPAQASNVLVSARRMFERVLRSWLGNTKKGKRKSTPKSPTFRLFSHGRAADWAGRLQKPCITLTATDSCKSLIRAQAMPVRRVSIATAGRRPRQTSMKGLPCCPAR